MFSPNLVPQKPKWADYINVTADYSEEGTGACAYENVLPFLAGGGCYELGGTKLLELIITIRAH